MQVVHETLTNSNFRMFREIIVIFGMNWFGHILFVMTNYGSEALLATKFVQLQNTQYGDATPDLKLWHTVCEVR